jgi:RNA polymerase sigma-70 factor, ECF subfamily
MKEAQVLIDRARSGDSSALEELLGGIAPSIHRFGLRMCRNAQDAADVLQDTLLAVATHLNEFEGRSSFLSWVFTLTRTACSRRRRGMKNRASTRLSDVDEPTSSLRTPEEHASDHEIALAITGAVDSLSDENREVIVLRDIEGLSASEAADSLGISVDALKSRLHRAREALRSALRPILEPASTKPSAACPDVVALWSKKLEGDLRSEDCAAMEAHVKTCPTCGAACDALKRALLVCRQSVTPELAPEVQARVKAAVRAWTTGVRA